MFESVCLGCFSGTTTATDTPSMRGINVWRPVDKNVSLASLHMIHLFAGFGKPDPPFDAVQARKGSLGLEGSQIPHSRMRRIFFRTI